MTAASTAGPATRGIARGTMKGSFSVGDFDIGVLSDGKNHFKAMKNRMMPPEIRIVGIVTLRNPSSARRIKLKRMMMTRAMIKLADDDLALSAGIDVFENGDKNGDIADGVHQRKRANAIENICIHQESIKTYPFILIIYIM